MSISGFLNDFIADYSNKSPSEITSFTGTGKSNRGFEYADTQSSSGITDQMIDKLVKGFMTGLESYGQSAIKAESAAASAANAKQEEWMRMQQTYNTAERLAAQEFNQASADKQMAFQRSEREAAQTWSEKMSNTSYQRMIEDLKAAGLNPALAYTQGGSSAPTSSGSSGAAAVSSPASSSISSASKANVASGKNADVSMLRSVLQSVTSIVDTGISSVFSLFRLFK